MVIQSIVRFGLADRLEVHLDHVRMPVGKVRVKTKMRSLDLMIANKKSIVTVKAAIKCLAYALIIAMAWVHGDKKYKYTYGERLKQPVEFLLKASGVDLSNGGGFEEFRKFHRNLSL